jgi:pilus assembly protein FimV
MNLRKKNRTAILAFALVCAATSSFSMTLGKVRGAALLGQPLKLTIPIQLDASESASALCLGAEVFYGDTRQDSQRISVTSEFSPQNLSTLAYLTSTSSVDEPVVTVYFQAGCQTKSTRHFVLLAELTAQAVAPVEPVSPESQPVVPVTGSKMNGRPIANDRAADASPSRKRPLPEADSTQSILARSHQAPKNGMVRSRLKLLPIDLTQERDPTLKLSNELVMGDGENLQKRAEALALWKSLNATPQEILDADRRRQSMESDLNGLKVTTASNSQALRDLALRLETAESQRYANPLVFALVVVLLISTFGLVYLLFKWKQGGLVTLPWWRADEAVDRSAHTILGHSDEEIQPRKEGGQTTTAVAQSVVTVAPPASKTLPLTEVDINIDLQLDAPVLSEQSKKAGEIITQPNVRSAELTSRSIGHVDFAHSLTTNLRAVNTQEMLDVRQQADFFLTLGQHDEALRLLSDCVEGSHDSNPLIYLDLLKALHTLGRKGEFDHYRTDFNALFSGHVPVYAAFSQGGNGLEAYPEICQNIEAFWPSEQAIDYIEKRLVREADDGMQQTMDLEAFRDLLMLHGTARRIEASSESGLMPFMAAKTISSEVGATYAPNLDEFNLGETTQPMTVADGERDLLSVDLELPAPPGNLIDFDPADLSMPDAPLTRKS